jgi:hypothetical protein
MCCVPLLFATFNPLIRVLQQILRRLSGLRYIHCVLLPELGLADGPVAALLEDRPTQAFLRGSVVAVPGVNTVYRAPTTAEQVAWNTRVRSSLRATGLVPAGHLLDQDRVYPRGSGFFSREGIAAVGVSVVPFACSDTGESQHAIFSKFEAADVESRTERFFVDAWFSYDITGLTVDDPNAPVGRRLTVTEQNDAKYAVDLALGRVANVVADPVAPGHDCEYARMIFQRVALAAQPTILEIGFLCQPLLAYPFLGDVARAKAFFRRHNADKWDATRWLVASKLF